MADKFDWIENRKALGKWGEEKACEYLIEAGYIIVEQNFRCRAGEIDIIAAKGKRYIFVEVKTRRNCCCGIPREAVDWRKQEKIRRTACYFLHKHPGKAACIEDISLDVIEVYKENRKECIVHIENAF